MRVPILIISVLPILFAISASAGEEPEILDAATFNVTMTGDSVELPLKQFGNLTLIEASVADGPVVDFILDTGSSGSSINTGYVSANDMTKVGVAECVGPGGAKEVDVVEIDSIKVGGITVVSPTVIADDFDPLFAPFGLEIGGIFGYDFISKFVIELNYDDRLITIYKPEKFEQPAGVSYTDVNFHMNTPRIEASVNGDPGTFVLDLGNPSTVILKPDYVAKKNIIEKAPAKIPVKMTGAGGGPGLKGYEVRLDNITLGEYSFDEPVGIVHEEGSPGLPGGELGNLGFGIVSRFVLFLDYSNNRIGFVPGQRFDAPFDYNRSGILAVPAGDHFLVDSIIEGAPAAESVAAGDKIIAIEGTPVESFPYPEWITLRQGPAGSSFSVSIEKPDGMTEEVSIELVEIL